MHAEQQPHNPPPSLPHNPQTPPLLPLSPIFFSFLCVEKEVTEAPISVLSGNFVET